MSHRREFLKQACAGCTAMIGFSLLAFELESCKTADNASIRFSKNEVSVPLKQMEGKNLLLIKSPWLEYDIVLAKKSEADYVALKMICPHRDNPVVVTDTGFQCPSHGSEFDKDGNVTKGPSEQGLKRFPVVVNKNCAVISIAR